MSFVKLKHLLITEKIFGFPRNACILSLFAFVHYVVWNYVYCRSASQHTCNCFELEQKYQKLIKQLKKIIQFHHLSFTQIDTQAVYLERFFLFLMFFEKLTAIFLLRCIPVVSLANSTIANTTRRMGFLGSENRPFVNNIKNQTKLEIPHLSFCIKFDAIL